MMRENQYHVEIDGTRYETIVEAIVRAIAAVQNEELVDVDPIYTAVDPDALEKLLTSARDVTVRFEYVGHLVTVDSEGTVRVEVEPDSTTAGPTSD